jgi:hypothetical protein
MPVFKSVDKNFFKKWSKDMAYVLGFFAADGYITVNKRGGQFWCVDITDLTLLKKIRKVIKSEHKISSRIRKKEYKSYITYRIQIGSIEMCDDLRRLGYDERKTKCLAPPNIPSNFFSDFLRGYFDGDGNVWSGFVHKNRKVKTLAIQVVLTSCSFEFLSKIKQRLEEFFIVNGRLRKGQGNYYRLVYSIKSSLKLYDFMYNGVSVANNNLYLQRKKKIFEKYIKMRS